MSDSFLRVIDSRGSSHCVVALLSNGDLCILSHSSWELRYIAEVEICQRGQVAAHRQEVRRELRRGQFIRGERRRRRQELLEDQGYISPPLWSFLADTDFFED